MPLYIFLWQFYCKCMERDLYELYQAFTNAILAGLNYSTGDALISRYRQV